MNNTWLILDSHYLCWRAYHTTGSLSYNEVRTGLVYGYLKALIDLQALFMTECVVHTFDKGKNKRKELHPEYKKNRVKEDTDEEQKLALIEVKNQIIKLRKEYLPEIGCRNIVFQKGYEADDIIAVICQNLPVGDKAVIISSDHDLYQLLNCNVSIYDPRLKTTTTEDSFKKLWGIGPSQWPYVKAMAGCNSDNVKGIAGVGEKTAVKFLTGSIKKESKTYKKIIEGEAIWKRNLPLVKLPLEGTNKVELLVEGRVSRNGWEGLTKRLGIKSLNYNRFLPYK